MTEFIMTSPASISRLHSIFSAIVFALTLSSCNQSDDPANNSTINQASSTAILLDVYKSESCGCCGLWVEHMENNNFSATIHHPQDLNAVKLEYGIDPQWQSCHTAVSKNGFVFEGHIPAKYVQQFLDNPPENAIGLAVAGMPLGSPGMEVGDRFTPYDIQLLKADGSTLTYAKIDNLADQF